MKKFISVLVSIIILLGMFNTGAFAAEEYVIATAEDFVNYISGVNNGTIQTDAVLNADIDLGKSDTVYVSPEEEFVYSFDGNNHTISGVEKPLFTLIGGSGEVKNLVIKGTITGDDAASVAVTNNGTITNVKNAASVIGKKYAAGIVCNNNGTITVCENHASVSALDKAYGAGIVDFNLGSVEDCVNYGEINGVDGNSYSDNIAGIAAYCQGNGTFSGNINVGDVRGGEYTGGIVGKYESYIGIYKCINAGNVYGSTYVGGISGKGYYVSKSVNYGDVVATGDYVAGGCADAYTVSDCNNYGAVSGKGKVAGIAAVLYGDITDTCNYGAISGSECVSGIVALSYYGTIKECINYGDVSGIGNCVAGVIAKGESLNLDRCANYGAITAGVGGNTSANYAAGVASFITEADGAYARDLYSVGSVTGMGTVGAVVAYLDYDAFGGFKYIHGNSAIQDTYASHGKYMYNYMYWGWDTEYSSKFSTGELAWMLNTYEGTTPNRKVWSQGELYPVFADSNLKPTEKIICKYNGVEKILYTGADGYAKYDKNIPADAEFINEDNVSLTYDQVFGTKAKSEKVYVYTCDEFVAAANDTYVSEIELVRGFTVPGSISLNSYKKIIGNNNRIVFSEGGISTTVDLTLDSVSIESQSPVVSDGGKLKIRNHIEVSAPLEVKSGSIELAGGRIINPSAKDGIPDFIAREGVVVNADGYVNDGENYTYMISSQNDAPWNIVAKAEDNTSLNYDVYATFRGNNVYMFMPCTADVTDITLTLLTKDGSDKDKLENLDLSNGKTMPVKVKGTEHTLSAMQSTLPTLSFMINEEWGTIEAMNFDPAHDVKCFGDVRLDVLPELENEETGWVGFVSKENDEKKKGTMEIKGRGNSTWSTEPGVKRPYQFKVEKKTDVLGMGKHKTWIILKNDEQIVRNKLGLDLAGMIGLKYSGKGEFVDVFMNGEYLGNYLLCEKVEVGDNRVEISDLDDEFEDNGETTEGLDMTGGYLMEIDNWGGDELQIYHESSNTVLSVKSPEDLAKTVTADNEYGYIHGYMSKWLDAVHSDGVMEDGRSYLDYINVESFVRYFFHQEFLRNGDCGRGSTYMYKDKDSIDPLIYAGPVWDNDRIFEGINNTDGWLLSTINHAGTSSPTFYNVLNRREDFAKLLVWYYENSDISEVLKSASSLIDKYIAQLDKSPEMNKIRWGYTNDFNITWLKTIMDERFAWIDANYATLTDIAVPEMINIDRTVNNGTVVFDVFNNTSAPLNAKVYVAEYNTAGAFKCMPICAVPVSLSQGQRSEQFSFTPTSGCDSCSVFLFEDNLRPVYKKIRMDYK